MAVASIFTIQGFLNLVKKFFSKLRPRRLIKKEASDKQVNFLNCVVFLFNFRTFLVGQNFRQFEICRLNLGNFEIMKKRTYFLF